MKKIIIIIFCAFTPIALQAIGINPPTGGSRKMVPKSILFGQQHACRRKKNVNQPTGYTKTKPCIPILFQQLKLSAKIAKTIE